MFSFEDNLMKIDETNCKQSQMITVTSQQSLWLEGQGKVSNYQSNYAQQLLLFEVCSKISPWPCWCWGPTLGWGWPRNSTLMSGGVRKKFRITNLTMPNNFYYMIWAKQGKKWLRYHQWPMQPLFGLWFWRPWNKTSLPFSLFSPYSIPAVCKNGQDCAEHFYMMTHHSTQPRSIWKKGFRG